MGRAIFACNGDAIVALLVHSKNRMCNQARTGNVTAEKIAGKKMEKMARISMN